MGVWIEIIQHIYSYRRLIVTPLAGVWIEMPFCQLPLPPSHNSCYTKTKHSNRKKVAAMGFFKKKKRLRQVEILTEKMKSSLLKRAFAMGSRLLDLKIFIQAE